MEDLDLLADEALVQKKPRKLIQLYSCIAFAEVTQEMYQAFENTFGNMEDVRWGITAFWAKYMKT